MRQESDNSTPFTPPSLSDLLARFVAEQSERLAGGGLPFEPGSEVQLHGAGAAQAADPRPAWEEAALAWHAGRREEAARLWAGIEGSVPALFNRGMAALFLGKPAAAVAPLRQAVAQLPESSSWHHLGQLYLTLAEMRQ